MDKFVVGIKEDAQYHFKTLMAAVLVFVRLQYDDLNHKG